MTWLTTEEEILSRTRAVKRLERMRELEREFGQTRTKVVERTLKGVRIKYVERKKREHYDSKLV